MPEASGSRVPAWPAFLALKARFTTATACVEVMPTPLSSTSQPLTSRFFGRGSRLSGTGAFGSLMGSVVPLVQRLRQIALHLLAPQDRLDARRLLEALVATAERHHIGGGEPQVRRHAHLRNGDDVPGQHRVLKIAARHDLGERMAH